MLGPTGQPTSSPTKGPGNDKRDYGTCPLNYSWAIWVTNSTVLAVMKARADAEQQRQNELWEDAEDLCKAREDFQSETGKKAKSVRCGNLGCYRMLPPKDIDNHRCSVGRCAARFCGNPECLERPREHETNIHSVQSKRTASVAFPSTSIDESDEEDL